MHQKGTEVSKAKSKNCRVFVVANPKGGVGKTTLLVNMAAMRQARGGNVIIIDTDKQGTASKWAERRNRHPELEGTVQCIQAFNELVATTVKGFRATYSDIFIDTAGRDSADLRRSWGMADDVLIPMSLSLFDLEHIADLHETYLRMQEFNPDANVSIILRPQTNPRREELQRAYDEIAEKTSIPIANVHFPERRIHYRATDKGWSSEEIGGTADETKRTDPGVTDMLNIYGYLYG